MVCYCWTSWHFSLQGDDIHDLILKGQIAKFQSLLQYGEVYVQYVEVALVIWPDNVPQV